MSFYFVSDIHIQKESDPRGVAFLEFLKTLSNSNCKKLFLVGDIFDLWIGKHLFFLREYKSIIEQIDELKQSGIDVYYFEGNHDLYLKYFWEDMLGIKVITDELEIELDGKLFRIEHGDKANPDDKGYLFLRKFLRSKGMDFFANNMPGRIISWIGETASSASRNYTNQFDHNKIELVRTYAQSLAQQRHFDFLITGHLHILDDFSFEMNGQQCRSINLGSWLDGAKYFTFENHIWQKIELP